MSRGVTTEYMGKSGVVGVPVDISQEQTTTRNSRREAFV
jgi:hypothetical protein